MHKRHDKKWTTANRESKLVKNSAPGEDRTHDLQMTLFDYETDALPTALPRHIEAVFFNFRKTNMVIIKDKHALLLNIKCAQST